MIPERRAVEALRSGVPNRDAVLALGCGQRRIEAEFERRLDKAEDDYAAGRQTAGLLLKGDFGSGKSHTLEYLQHLAQGQRFVTSRIAVSKETPLYDPVKVCRAAIEAAVAPGTRGSALTEIAARLDFAAPPFADFQRRVNDPKQGYDGRFPATLFLFERLSREPEMKSRILRFWAGDKLGVTDVKRALKEHQSPAAYVLGKANMRDLALQRFQFTAGLIRAAGYAGWVLLMDEVELIARYSLAQRGKSYAELARWMGKLGGSGVSGLFSVLAITQEFQGLMLDEKNDIEKIPLKFRSKGSEADLLLASQAERGMRLLEREGLTLTQPASDDVERTYAAVRSLHAQAYAWTPPEIRSAKRETSTRMRQYIKGWITEWDLRRLFPEHHVDLETQELRQRYNEDRNLEIPYEDTDEPDSPESHNA